MNDRCDLLAVVQDAPVLLDRAASVERACQRIKEASAGGARLVLLPEAFVPGYPDWVWRVPGWDDRPLRDALAQQAVVVGDDATQRLAAAATDGDVWVAIGITERTTENATLYNSLLYLAPDGHVACHRKLMPTGAERTVWGQGDGSTLHAFDTDIGRVGGLICWENLMPLARTAMYGQGTDIHLAPTWDNSDAWLSTLRHIAREGGVYLLSTNSCIRASDVPRTIDALAELYDGGDDDWLSRGNAAIVAPNGTVLAGPLIGEPGILYASVDLAEVRAARSEFDVVGHYARPDVLQLTIDDAPQHSVRFTTQRTL